MSNAASEEELASSKVGVAVTRDPMATARRLEAWIAERTGGAPVSIGAMKQPGEAGGSSETFFFTLDAGGTTRDLVLRIDPKEFRLFLRSNFDAQYKLLSTLERETDIPVPPIRFYEPDTGPLGAPFWIMDRVDGQVPPDNPSYNAGGFLFDASIEQRRAVWRSGMDVLGKLARLDWERLPAIVSLDPGESGLDENLRHWTQSMEWACEGKPTALIREANEWLWAHKPLHGATGLSWGDARIGNMIFRDWRCVAVLDWETITLAGPQLDLAHWLVMDDYSAECLGLERLPGLGTRAETIALWEDLSGLEADQLDWHEVLAVFRLTVIMERYARLWSAAGRFDIRDANGETLMARHLRRTLARVTGS